MELRNDNEVVLQSDEFDELPYGSPDTISVLEIDAEYYDEPVLDVIPTDSGGERKELSVDGTIQYIKEILKD